MIRTLWVGLFVTIATFGFGAVAIVASLVGVRGGIYTWLTRQWARTILWASAVPVTAVGLEHIRHDEAQIIVSNHVSGYDIFAIAAILPVSYHFVAKKELERILFFGTAWKAAGHISIDRSDRQSAIVSLRLAGERIREENSAVIIFAEGTRSRTGHLQPLKKGAFLLAAEAGVPIVPTVVKGSYDIMRPDTWKIRPHPIQIHFGEPIPAEEACTVPVDVLMERVSARMREMLGDSRPDARHVGP